MYVVKEANKTWYRLDDRVFKACDIIDLTPQDSNPLKYEKIIIPNVNKFDVEEGILLFNTERNAQGYNVQFNGRYTYEVSFEKEDIIPNYYNYYACYLFCHIYICEIESWRKLPIAKLDFDRDDVCFVRKAKVIKVIRENYKEKRSITITIDI